jgi:hypothetical protein
MIERTAEDLNKKAKVRINLSYKSYFLSNDDAK